MDRQNTTDNTTWFLVFLIIATALIVQFAGFINLDNSWLLHVAGRVVDGEKLGKQVIESNPPLIVYIMELPVYAAKFLNINPVYAFSGFICLIGVVSLLMTFSQISGRVAKIGIAFAVIFLPAWSFGEREHIFIMLIMPYFTSLWRTDKPGIVFAIISGLMAGIGLSLKPFFVIVLAVMVLTKMVLDRRFWVFFSVQNILIGLVMAAYLAYLVFIEKTYVNEVLPILVKYYATFNSSMREVLKQAFGIGFLCQIAFWIVYIKDRKLLTRGIYFASYANLASSLLIILQGRVWVNYFYPPDFFGFLSNLLIAIALFNHLKPLWNRVSAFISSFILMVFVAMSVTTNLKTAFRADDNGTKKVIAMINKYASGKPVYAFSFNLGTIFPAVVYSEGLYEGHYGHFWMLPGMYKDQPKKGEAFVFRQPGQRIDDETRLVGQVVGDFVHNPPELVFVMDSRYYSRGTGNYSFDFVKYFSIEPEFAEIWKHYKKIGRIGDRDVYLYQGGL